MHPSPAITDASQFLISLVKKKSKKNLGAKSSLLAWMMELMTRRRRRVTATKQQHPPKPQHHFFYRDCHSFVGIDRFDTPLLLSSSRVSHSHSHSVTHTGSRSVTTTNFIHRFRPEGSSKIEYQNNKANKKPCVEAVKFSSSIEFTAENHTTAHSRGARPQQTKQPRSHSDSTNNPNDGHRVALVPAAAAIRSAAMSTMTICGRARDRGFSFSIAAFAIKHSKESPAALLVTSGLKDLSNLRLNCNNLNSHLTLHSWAPFLGAQ